MQESPADKPNVTQEFDKDLQTVRLVRDLIEETLTLNEVSSDIAIAALGCVLTGGFMYFGVDPLLLKELEVALCKCSADTESNRKLQEKDNLDRPSST